MTCPFLEYRDESDGTRFDEARAYCTAADRFVQPMRADVCNDRYELAHDRHCEIYLEHAGGADPGAPGDDSEATGDDREPASGTDGGDPTGGDR